MKYLRHEHHNDDGVITAVVFEAYNGRRRFKNYCMRRYGLSSRQWVKLRKMKGWSHASDDVKPASL